MSTQKNITSKSGKTFPAKLKAKKGFVLPKKPEELKKLKTRLEYLSLNYDPFKPEEKTLEIDGILQEFFLSDKIHDPFLFTNTILKLLDEAEDRLKSFLN